MSKHKIEWTNKTWNPIVGCTKLRKGCKNCYAERMAKRLMHMGQMAYDAAIGDDGRWMGTVYLREDQLCKPKFWKKGCKIFVCSMSDLFHEKLAAVARDRIFAAMLSAPQHTYQIVTKRYKEAAGYTEHLMEVYKAAGHCGRKAIRDSVNIHWLFSASDQSEVNEACENLMYLQVATSGLYLEPLLGPVVLPGHVPLDWVIVGGESGPGARPMNPQWVLALRDQCQDYHIPFFFKQWGAWEEATMAAAAAHGYIVREMRQGVIMPANPNRYKYLNLDGSDYQNSPQIGATPMARVGKKKAGRILDGRTWEEYPTETTSV